MNSEAMQNELGRLRQQLELLLRRAQETKDTVSSEMIDKLSKQIENLRANAGEHMQNIYHAGQAGVTETEKFVRQNPLLSLGIAFGAGCLLAGILKR